MKFFSSLFGSHKPGDPSADPGEAVPYRFNEPKNTACFTCKHVVREGATILHVTHDADDGGWQFLCGGDHAEDDVLILGMGEIVRIDPSVNALYQMPEGFGAARETRDGEWRPFKLE